MISCLLPLPSSHTSHPHPILLRAGEEVMTPSNTVVSSWYPYVSSWYPYVSSIIQLVHSDFSLQSKIQHDTNPRQVGMQWHTALKHQAILLPFPSNIPPIYLHVPFSKPIPSIIFPVSTPHMYTPVYMCGREHHDVCCDLPVAVPLPER